MRSQSPADATRPEAGPGRSSRNAPPAQAALTLRERVGLARRRSRPGRPVLVAVSWRVQASGDPAASMIAARRAGEAWFCIAQPERRDSLVLGLGTVHELRSSGTARFADLQRQWRALSERAICDGVAGPPGAGLIAAGGFAFADDGAGTPRWAGFDTASLIVPELALAQSGGETWITFAAAVGPDDLAEDLTARMNARVAALVPAQLPLLDPAPVGRFAVHSPMPPAHYEEAVRRAVQRIREGQLEKIVLAREVEVQAPAPHDPAAVLGALRGRFPGCFIYAVGRGGQTFLGATPELLVRREGERASTVALAGTTRRSTDAALDRHLGQELLRSGKNLRENMIVARRIAASLKPFSVWVTVAPEPVLVKVANVQHLAIPIRAQLRGGSGVLELAGALHPTPAVGGEPSAAARQLIPALEGFDRGWYAGTVGWTDTGGDGEFCVGLRCALLDERRAWCFAGAGIVEGSDPAAELAETEVKLQAMLSVLAG